MKEKKGRTDVPRARRPVKRPATTNACVRRRRLFTGGRRSFDRLSFCLQEALPTFNFNTPFSASLRLCAGGRVGGSALFPVGGGTSCLRVFVFAPWAGGICVHLCDLWAALCVSVVFSSMTMPLSGRFNRSSVTVEFDASKANSPPFPSRVPPPTPPPGVGRRGHLLVFTP
jgi:hypothetical protein